MTLESVLNGRSEGVHQDKKINKYTEYSIKNVVLAAQSNL